MIGLLLVAGCPAAAIPFPAEILTDWYGRVGDASALAAVTEQYADLPIPAEVLGRIGDAAARVPLEALTGTLGTCLTSSFVEALGAVQVPTLVVGGKRDSIFSPDVLRGGVVETLSSARLAQLECGHEIPVEAPVELAAVVEGFLAGLNV